MNKYEIDFSCLCPVNNERIDYSLVIRHDAVIKAEDLQDFVEQFADVKTLHEELADQLEIKFPGEHTLVATHGGVTITTTRP